MHVLAFICTLPDAWDPFCRPEQALGLASIGALIGLAAAVIVGHQTGGNTTAAVLFGVIAVPALAVLAVVAGIMLSG
ncbi:MAG: hypothetical protein AAGD35_13145 [Actinomycetota bacterium]